MLEQIINDNPRFQAGVYDKQKYYRETSNGLTIFDSIHLDVVLLSSMIEQGLNPEDLKTFLIAGCYSRSSIEAVILLINQIIPEQNVTLIVTDINQEAFELINKHPIETPPKIKLVMFRGDLTKIALKSGSVDYVRMDYLQNFVPEDKQLELFKEMSRVTSESGMVVSMVENIPKAKTFTQQVIRRIFKGSGSRVDHSATRAYGFNRFLPSEEFLNKIANHSGFVKKHIASQKKMFFDNTVSSLCVFTKKKK